MENQTDNYNSLFARHNQEMKPSIDVHPFVLTATQTGKTSFLVLKNNKYLIVPVERIAFFHVKYESSVIACYDGGEYFLNNSLDHIQTLLNANQFFRLNRQYLINFSSIKEVEHYFARKLLVNLSVPVAEKLLVTKEKVTGFLRWLDNR